MKQIMDPIHGLIDIDPELIQMIDTPQFQRLRNISQMGPSSYVFPGATHKRFGHSIGTSSVAGDLLDNISRAQPDLKITPRETLLIKAAGLCHDLGHGPLSHSFDNFMHRFFPDIPWAHEQASTMMFDNMVDENNIDISRSDINFIHELIDPKRNVATQSRKFLYDVVSNSRNSVDVDKFDYLSRDCYYLGMKSFFDSDRLIRMARVVNDEICYPAKHAFSMYQLFYTRYSLHKTVYSHKVAQAIEFMIMDALLEADPVFGISKSVSDPEAYLHMTDAVVSRIEFSTDPSLQRSRQILKDINLRKLYKVAGETVMTYADGQRLGVISEVDITSRQPANGLLVPDRIIVQKFHLDFAMKNGNPLSRVSFFNSSDPDTSFKMEKSSISSIIPDMFSECILRVYVKDATDWNMECARIALAKFGRDHGLPSPGPCHSRASTPAKQVSFARPLDKLSSTKLNFGEKRRRGLDADDFPHSDA